MTLNEVVKNIQKLTAQDFTSLIIMYMAATLLFPGNKCTVPWYLVEQIVNIHMMNRINWAKGVRQNLLESLEKFRVSTSELPGCTLQILYWFCERVAIVAQREEFTDKLPRAVRWDLHQLNIALDNNVDLAKIEKEKILNRMANITEAEMTMIKCIKKSEPTQDRGKQTDEAEVAREETAEDREEQQEEIIPPREHGGFIAASRDEAAEELVILRNQNNYLRGYVYQLEKQIEVLKEEKEREEKDRKKKERRMKRKLQEEEDSKKRRKVQEEEDENQRKEKKRKDDEAEERRMMEEEKRRKDDKEERIMVEEKRREEEKEKKMEEEKMRKDDQEKERIMVEEKRREEEKEKKKMEEEKRRKDDEEKERRIMVEEKRMEEKRSEEKLADVTISFLYQDLDSKQRDVLKNFFDKASKSDPAYNDPKTNLYISGKDIEDIMFDQYITGDVINVFMRSLKERRGNKCLFFQVEAWIGIRDGYKDFEDFFIRKNLTDWKPDTDFMFFPMNHSCFHWTLLIFDCQNHDFILYNSLVHQDAVSRANSVVPKDAKAMLCRLLTIFNEEIASGSVKVKKIEKQNPKLKYARKPQQKNSVDCGLYVCKYMEWLALKCLFDLDSVTQKTISQMRAILAYNIITDKEFGWDEKATSMRDKIVAGEDI